MFAPRVTVFTSSEAVEHAVSLRSSATHIQKHVMLLSSRDAKSTPTTVSIDALTVRFGTLALLQLEENNVPLKTVHRLTAQRPKS